MNQAEPNTTHSGSFGLALILVAAFFLFFAQEIGRTGLTGNRDPGPRAFPLVISGCLLAGGVWEWAVVLWRRFRPLPAAAVAESMPARPGPAPGGTADVVLLVIAMVLYFGLIAVVGFLLGTFVFAAVMCCRLGARWWVALLVSAALVLTVQLLFVMMFEVRLPSGVWDLVF